MKSHQLYLATYRYGSHGRSHEHNFYVVADSFEQATAFTENVLVDMSNRLDSFKPKLVSLVLDEFKVYTYEEG